MASKLDKSIKNQIEPQYKLLGSAEKVGKQLKISPSTVVRHLKKLGYDFSMYQKHSLISYEEGLQKFPQEGLSLAKFCSKYQLSAAHFGRFLRKNGIHIPNLQNEVKFNDCIFDVIDTEEKAYWLGFMYADGNIDSTKKVIAVNLSEKDSDHLEKFKKFLNYSHELMHVFDGKHHKCRLSVTNHHMWDTLNSYGCTPKKSLTIKFPSEDIFKDKSLIKHFIRGYWDGDGTLTWRNKEHTRAEMGALGTENFLNTMQKYLPIGFRKIQTKHPDGALECKSYQVEDAIAFKLAFFLYEGATVYMNRKYDVFKKYCRLYEKLYRELQTNIGEGCDANTEITEEIKESSAS